MNEVSILLLMILCHIIDDFVLQGKLAEMKQRKFWEQYDQMYSKDYIVCLLLHGVEWGIMVSLPVMFFGEISALYVCALVVMCVVHSYVDHLKCNKFKINLVEDQTIHIIQVVALFICSLL